MKYITEEVIKEAALNYVNDKVHSLFDQHLVFEAGADFVLNLLREEQHIFNLLDKPLYEETILKMKEWLERNKNQLTDTNEIFDLRVDDEILFKNGYDVPMRTKITAFGANTNEAYLYWDCYWFPIDLNTRFIIKF